MQKTVHCGADYEDANRTGKVYLHAMLHYHHYLYKLIDTTAKVSPVVELTRPS